MNKKLKCRKLARNAEMAFPSQLNTACGESLTTVLTASIYYEEAQHNCTPKAGMFTYFTNPINTDVVFVGGARSTVFHLAGHCKEKFKVLSLAV